MEINMKKLILVLLIIVLFFPCICHSQSIFVDFVWIHENDISIYWVLTDPNNRKYKGHCDVALDTDPNIYLNEHMDEWLAEIYEMNTDANIPDWVNTHLGKYTQTINQINNMDTWPELQAFQKKVIKYLQKTSAISD